MVDVWCDRVNKGHCTMTPFKRVITRAGQILRPAVRVRETRERELEEGRLPVGLVTHRGAAHPAEGTTVQLTVPVIL